MLKTKLLNFLLVFMLLTGVFSGCSSETPETQDIYEVLFGEIRIGLSDVRLGDLSFGTSQEDVFSAEGLNESDVQIRDIEDIGSRFVVVQEKYIYDELDPYGTQKTFTFVDDGLSGIAYSVAYRDVPHEDAYASAMGVYEKLDGILESTEAEFEESGSIDSLDQVGGDFTKQWTLGGTNISLNMNYQDMSGVDFTDMDQFNLSINFTPAK